MELIFVSSPAVVAKIERWKFRTKSDIFTKLIKGGRM